MKCAKVSFWGKEGISGVSYSYACDGYESGLIKGDWVIVSSARSKYSLGVFIEYAILDKPEDIAIVTQKIVGTTALKERG